MWWHDRGAIREAHAYGLETLFPDSTLVAGATRKKALSDSAVLAQAKMRLQGQSPVGDVDRPGERRTVFSFVMRRGADGWRCAAAPNTDVVVGAETHVRDAGGTLRPADYRTGAPR